MRQAETEKLKKYTPPDKNFEDMYAIAEKRRKRRHDFALLWHLTRQLSGGDVAKWRDIFLDIGVVGAYDANSSIIHKNEQQQGVLFTKDAYQIVEVFENELKKWDFDQEKMAANRKESSDQQKQVALRKSQQVALRKSQQAAIRKSLGYKS